MSTSANGKDKAQPLQPWTKSLAAGIQPQTEVLEIYPGGGRLTQHMHEVLECNVVTIERDREAHEAARPFAAKALFEDIEEYDWERTLHPEQFDYVILQNVLEQLYNPVQLLMRINRLLKPGGQLLLTTYNAAYEGVLTSLLQNHFYYRENGVLSFKNLQLLDRKNMESLLYQAGFHAAMLKAYPIAIEKSEFSDVPPIRQSHINHYVKDRATSASYQYLTVAVKQAFYDANKQLFDKSFKASAQTAFRTALYFAESPDGDEKAIENLTLVPGERSFDFEITDGQTVRALRWQPVANRSFHCSNVVLVGSGISLHPVSNTADFTTDDGVDYFLSQGGSYAFTSQPLPAGKYTMYYHLQVDYDSERTKKTLLSQVESYDAQLAIQSKELENNAAQIKQLEQELLEQHELTAENKETTRRVEQRFNNMAEDLQREYYRKDDEWERATDENQENRQLIARQQQQLAALQTALDGVTESRFWKVTRPFRALNNKIKSRRQVAPPPRPSEQSLILTPPLADGEELPALDVSVSYIIPTLQGGAAFGALLDALKEQQGIGEAELIVVDSGSDDGTVERAQKVGAEVIEIKQADFSHSYARNLGAEKAQHDVLFFLTQDALPTGEWWVRRTLHPLVKGAEQGVAAVSMVEKPREDADIYYRYLIWSHHTRLMGLDGKDRLVSMPPSQDGRTLRRHANLNDNACAIRAEVFREFQFEGDFCEDLDLGLRLIAAGHTLALLATEQVVHSHNRPASYYLKRAYADKAFEHKTFADSELVIQSRVELLFHILQGYMQWHQLNEFAKTLDKPAMDGADFEQELLQRLDRMQLTYPYDEIPDELPPSGDAELDEFLQSIHAMAKDFWPVDSGMIALYHSFLQDDLFVFLAQQEETSLSRQERQQILDAVLNFYATRCGYCLYAYAATSPATNNTLGDIAAQLVGGV